MRISMARLVRIGAATLGLLALTGSGAAAQRAAAGFRDSVTVVPGKRYKKDPVYRFFFGDHYRDLWTTPIRVPVLDLATFAGGLKPTKKGGGQQTKSLRLDGADGRQYQFRSVDKDPSSVLPLGLRETFADRIFQDQISAGHPVGALLVPPVLEAAGVLHAEPVLVMMPDDPALGEFRSEFANVLGTIEERPRGDEDDEVVFAGAKEIVSTEDLFKEVENHPNVQVDEREFLVARLTDVFLGDWDRHADQWRWARMDDGAKEHWHPIPRDRDQAFVKFDGLLLKLVRKRVPQLVKFGPKFSSIEAATWNGRDLDHHFLTDLDRQTWDSVAHALQGKLTNQVIDAAVAELPPEYQPIDGPRLRSALIARRDDLMSMAADYYKMLATHVDVEASDEADLAIAQRSDSGVLVTVATAAKPADPYFRRFFNPRETKDVRIYLHGAADSAVARGEGANRIKLRFIGGGGDDRFVNEGAGSVKFYDDRGENTAVGGSINTKPYQAIDDTTDKTALPHRDWGSNRLLYPVASYNADAGVQFGVGGRFVHWGFRKKPYASSIHYSARFASGAGTGKLAVDARFQWENSRNFWEIKGHVSGVETLRWFGFGNDTPFDPSKTRDFYRATDHEVRFEPSLGWSLGESVSIILGPRFKYSAAELDESQNANRFIALDRPFGTGSFAQVAGGAELVVDTRDEPLAPRHGVNIELGGEFIPALLDVEKPLTRLHASAATYLSAARFPTKPVLALQGGATKIFGTLGKIPFHDAAFLGSSTTLRGYQNNRFAGDAAVFGSAELRLHLTSLFLLVPGTQGIFGFVDGGRVYFEGETSTTWHHTYGGGVWFAFLTPGSLLSVTYGQSGEGSRIYVRAGFAF
jgi:hypothetical protein